MPECDQPGELWGEMLLALVSFAGTMMCGTAALFMGMLGGDQENTLLALAVSCCCLLTFASSFKAIQESNARTDH